VLVCAELLVSGFFSDVTPEECASLCSALVAQRIGNKNEPHSLGEKLDEKEAVMEQLCEDILSQMVSYGVDFLEPQEEWVPYHCNPAPMEAVLLWAQGAEFVEIMQPAVAQTIPEGAMIRILLQTCGLLDNFQSASKLVGDPALTKLFTDATSSIKRGLVFASSLYLD
jgi:ATP-dependent RNA helicase DOB1